MTLNFEPMTAAHAHAILQWRYEPPYDFYNLDPLAQSIRQAFLIPDYHYYAVLDEDRDLIAFRCFGEDARVAGGDYNADALDTGGGLRPDLTGRGLGAHLMIAAIEFARPLFRPRAFRATVAGFNLRALRACEKAGYVQVQKFVSREHQIPFVILMQSSQGLGEP